MEFACRVDAQCKKAFPSKQARGLHELSHRPQEQVTCPQCGKLTIKRLLANHQRKKHGSGRVLNRAKRERKPATRRTIGSILEELYDAVALFEAEYEAMRKRLEQNDERMVTIQKAIDAANAPRSAKPPRL